MNDSEKLLNNLQRIDVAIREGTALEFTYTNYKGETARRLAVFKCLGFVLTARHGEGARQWIADGLCADRGEVRAFAVADMTFDQE